MEKAKSKYRLLRGEILDSSVPSPGKLICLCLVEHYPNISPGTALLVKRTGYSRTTILKTLGELEEWGVITIQRVKWKPSIYTFTGNWSVPEKPSGKRTSAGGGLVNEATGLVREVNQGLVREVNPKQSTPKQTTEAANVFVEFALPTSTSPGAAAPRTNSTGTPRERNLSAADTNGATLSTQQSMPAPLHGGDTEAVSVETGPPGGVDNETASQHASRPNQKSQSSKKRKTSKTECPDDWEPRDSKATGVLEQGLDRREQLNQFRDHHKAKGSLFADWDAAWRNWLRNAHKFARSRQGSPPRQMPPRSQGKSNAEILKEFR